MSCFVLNLVLCTLFVYICTLQTSKQMQTLGAETNNCMLVSPKNKDSRWVALDSNDNIVYEGESPKNVLFEASKITDNPFLVFIPKSGETYIF